jgi:mRNA interferase YafQ
LSQEGAAPLRPARTHQFKRDLERCRKRGFDLDLIRVIMGRLIHREVLEPRLQDHALRGDWDAHRECHLRPDWLLIYRVADDQITFERTGTHTDLFGE